MSQFGYYLYVLMALSEEPQVASEVQRVSPARAKSLMGDSWIDKAPRAQTLERLLFHLCFILFVVTVFLWYLTWREWVCGDSPLPVM